MIGQRKTWLLAGAVSLALGAAPAFAQGVSGTGGGMDAGGATGGAGGEYSGATSTTNHAKGSPFGMDKASNSARSAGSGTSEPGAGSGSSAPGTGESAGSPAGAPAGAGGRPGRPGGDQGR